MALIIARSSLLVEMCLIMHKCSLAVIEACPVQIRNGAGQYAAQTVPCPAAGDLGTSFFGALVNSSGSQLFASMRFTDTEDPVVAGLMQVPWFV